MKPKVNIEYRPTADLKLLEHNPRTIKKADFERLKKSIKNNAEFFEARPIILSDRTGELIVIAGNQRLRASQELGIEQVPTVLLEGLTEAKEREIIIRDNVSNGDWDMDILANEWQVEDLIEWGVDAPKPVKEIKEDDAPKLDEWTAESERGKIYQLGRHKVYCGSFDDDTNNEMFGDELAEATFTDPPYNVDIQWKNADIAKRLHHRTDGKGVLNDAMSDSAFSEFILGAFETIKARTVVGGGVISWCADKSFAQFWEAMEEAGLKPKQSLVWVKNTFPMSRTDFQYVSEPAIYNLGEEQYPKNTDGGESERGVYARDGGKFHSDRTIQNAWFFKKPARSEDHPTMKPIGLCAKGILCLSDPKDLIYDPFLGSGSTLIACEQTDRKCYGSELDPRYCDVIRKRWVALTTGSEENWQGLTPPIN